MSDHGVDRRRFLTVSGLSLGVAALPTGATAATPSPSPARAETWENIIEKSSFDSWTAFDREWNRLYPWGGDDDTHNGAARMHAGQISLSGGVLTLKATRLAAADGTSPHKPHAPLWYRSGAIHAREQIIVNDQFPEYDIEGEFSAQTGPGIWPAFWTTGEWPAWPPETDILEYVGDSTNLFNTWNKTSSGDEGEEAGDDYFVTRERVPVANPAAWHKYRVWMYKDGDDVGLNQQLPGPTGDTQLRARNVWVGRTRAW
ncbi:family 16 glycosylhydrolase [Nonomuraea harbinensis]|uniref:Family 16 glycosylhydrolase n=1 Tax=Nonomuraea harbinensis TaxID=1286938 RepID=A0ABW1C0M9_9ACTN|nr:family 16 glycosylhydrolase [Nonomuraea harbinensis]